VPTQGELRVRADIVPQAGGGFPAQSVDSVRLFDAGNDQNVNIRIQEGISVSGTVQVRWPPDGGPDVFGNDDPTRGLASVVVARQIGGIGFGSVEVLPGEEGKPSSGSFRMTLPPGSYDVEVAPTEFTAAVTRQLFSERIVSAFGHTFNFVLSRGHNVSGLVSWADSGGEGIRFMTVQAWRFDKGQWNPAGPSFTTDESGAFTMALPDGEYELRFFPDAQNPEAPLLPEHRVALNIPDGVGEAIDVIYPLWPTATLIGSVVDGSGGDLAGVTIIADGAVSNAAAGGDGNVVGGSYEARTESEDGGVFQMRLPYGNGYRLRIVPPPLAVAGARELSGAKAVLVDGDQIDLGEIVLLDKPRLTGLVTDVEGRPVVGALVLAGNQDISGHSASSVTDEDGRYLLTLDPGLVRLEVLAPSGEGLVDSGSFNTDLGSGGEVVDISLERGRTISGVILDPRLEPIAGARIDFVHPDTQVLQGSGISDLSGRYRLTIPFKGLPADFEAVE